MHSIISFSSGWIDSRKLDYILSKEGELHLNNIRTVLFHFKSGCKIMADSGIRLLSLANQLHHNDIAVTLEFADGQTGAMGYLNRMGFFDHLANDIEVTPPRPAVSKAVTYRGTNAGLVEIAKINPKSRDNALPNRLANAVSHALKNRSDVDSIGEAIFTVFAELIDNIFSHSATVLDGYVAMQVYPGGNNLQVAVCDSGHGIIETLRPTIEKQSPKLAALSDIDLLVEVFRQGLSRHGPDRGCGLKGSAQKAMKYNADLEIRLPRSGVLLVPANGIYQANTAYCFENLPLVWGTHISFKFDLDPAKVI